MKEFSRRKFLTGAAALAALYPVIRLVESCNGNGGGDHDLVETFKFGDKALNKGLRYIQPNGAYLYFYFVNAVVKSGDVVPVVPTEDSYMVLQLPPQSLHEMSLSALPEGCQVPAALSRSSFLTFKLWPGGGKVKRSFSFSMPALMEWENEVRFRLMTTLDVPKERYRKFSTVVSTFAAEISTSDQQGAVAINGYEYYKLVLSKLFIEKKDAPDPFISVFEIPAGLITVPHIRDKNRVAKFIQNNYKVSSAFYKIKVNGKDGIRKVYERWYGQMIFADDVTIKSVNVPGAIPPVLRAIGLRKLKVEVLKDKSCDGDGTVTRYFFPNFLPNHEIIYLNQLYNESEAYDLKSGSRTEDGKTIPSPFLLTSSGATVKFSYYNLKPGPGVNLVEYEHHFQNGRDIYIRIAEIGVMTPSTEKAVHVKVARRQIAPDGRSFMEYKEYIKTLDEFAKFPKFAEQSVLKTTEVDYRSVFTSGIDDLGDDPQKYTTYTNRIPFCQVRSLFKESPPIRITNPKKLYFWVYKETAKNDNYDNLLQLPFQYTDRNMKVFATDSPVFFMRKTFFENAGAVNSLLGEGDLSKSVFAAAETDKRLRLAFNNEVISYTPDPPQVDHKQGALSEAADTDKNKLNQLPTEYIEYYFDIAQSKTGDANFFNKWPLMVYIQMRRAKVYFDHFQHFSGDKLASVIKLNEDYLMYRFDEVKNKAKLILDHRKDFMKDQWLNFSATVTAKTDALDDKFKAGYERVRNMFTNAGSSIGPSINPGLEPERFGLVKDAFSLGENVNRDLRNTKDRFQKTADLFKGASADILNGIPFKSILTGLIDSENSPQFLLKKIAGEIESLNKFLDQINNDVVSKVVTTVKDINGKLQKVKGQIDTAENEIKIQQDKINGYKNQILQAVPDYATARNAVLQLFEIQALRFINDIKITATDIRQHIYNETVHAWQKMLTDTKAATFTERATKTIDDTKGKIQKLVDEKLKPLALSAPPQVKKIIDDMVANLTDPATGAVTHLGAYSMVVDKLFTKVAAAGEETGLLSIEQFFNKAVTVVKVGQVFIINPPVAPANYEAVNWEDIIWSKVAWDQRVVNNAANWGLDQLKQLEIQLRAAAPKTVVGLDQVVKDIQNAIVAKTTQIESSLYTKAVNCARDLKASVTATQSFFDEQTRNTLEQVIEFVNLIAQSSPAWYYNKYKVLQKDYTDLYSRVQSFRGLITDLPGFFSDDKNWIKNLSREYTLKSGNLADAIFKLQQDLNIPMGEYDIALANFNGNLQTKLQDIVQNNPASKEVAALLRSETASFDTLKKGLNDKLQDYEAKLRFQAQDMITQLTASFEAEISKEIDSGKMRAARDAFNKFLNLYNSIRRQELNYNWQTKQFQPVTIGIIKFTPESNPDTLMKVKVSVVAILDPLHPGDVIERIDVQTETSIVNFSVTFLSAITLGFSEVSFKAGTGISSNTRVMIRDVKFEGALSFVQKLQEMLQSIGDGFNVEILPGHISMSYFFDFPVISTPGFTFANFAIGVGVNIYFDRRPMTVSFMLSRPERKAIVAAGIYGGGFFTNITADPKRGIKSIEMALEMGAYLGISIGPIHGEVKMMVGLYFKKDDSGVILEGYFVAEGTLSVWILSVSARIYLAVRSQNSVVEGCCTVTYEVKVGLYKKSFSGSFRRRLAGAESSSGQSTPQNVAALVNYETMAVTQRRASVTGAMPDADRLYLSMTESIEEDSYQVLTDREWAGFYSNFFS